MLSAEDYDADLAERYGWVNRALPAEALAGFVRSLAHRIASFPRAGRAVVKERVNAIALAPLEDFRLDSDLYFDGVHTPEAQRRIGAALKHGFQTRDAELMLARLLPDLADSSIELDQVLARATVGSVVDLVQFNPSFYRQGAP